VIGFTNGIALLIASTQIKDFLGLKIEKIPGEFFARAEALAAGSARLGFQQPPGLVYARPYSVLHEVSQARSGPIAAMLGGTVAVLLLKLPVKPSARVGGIPAACPRCRCRVPPLHSAHLFVPAPDRGYAGR